MRNSASLSISCNSASASKAPMQFAYHFPERVANLVESQHAHARSARGVEAQVAAATVPASRPTAETPTTVRFSLEPAAPRFVIATAEPLYEPVVLTDKSAPALSPRLTLDAPPVFSFATTAATAPRLALIR